MNPRDSSSSENRVLLLAPAEPDAQMCTAILREAGASVFPCADTSEICRELPAGAAAILLTEEAVVPGQMADLTAALADQPAWSDLPVLLLTHCESDSFPVAWAVQNLENVVLLDRSAFRPALLSAVRAALRNRRRQYELRTYLTQCAQAADALRESDERFRIVAENAEAVFGIVQGKRFVYVNPYLARISGYSMEELLAMEFVELVHPDFREQVADHARRRQMGEMVPPHYEFAMLTKDGRTRWMDMSVGRIVYKGRPAIVGTAYDVTKRKHMEVELRRSEAHFRDLAETMPQLVWIAGPDGGLEYFNRKCFELAGATFEQLKGAGWSNWLHPDDYQRTMDRWQHSLQTGEPYEIEYRLRRGSDGSYRWFLGRALPVRNEHGTIVRWFGTATDFHEQKELQKQLAVARRSAERAKQLAEEASRAKDHFLAVLSHELRTPLTPVLATVSLLQEEAQLDPDMQEHVQMIRRNMELEARLIDDLLDMTRISRGKVELHKQCALLIEVVNHAVEVCRPDIEAKRLNFGVDVGNAGQSVIEADVARLQQVFWNLLKNAVKFTPPGGCVGVRCRQSDGHVIAEVSDSGAGIEPEALPRIFNAFEQAELSITRHFGGLGLGLTISKALVEMHGGEIRAHSEGKGKGATFQVSLPLARPAGTSLRPLSPFPSAGSEPPRVVSVLLVEDHGDTAQTMTHLLKRKGYQVEHACDAGTALELAGGRNFDLLISDLGLPDLSGVDLIRELRARGHKLPAIALSGYGQEEDIKRSREAGFNAHVTKPVDSQHLFGTIAAAVAEGPVNTILQTQETT